MLTCCLTAVLALQTPQTDPVLSLADRLVAEGYVDEAITEYRRYLYFHRDRHGPSVSYASSQIAVAFRNKGRFDLSAAMYQRAIEEEVTAEGKDRLRLQLAVTEMLRGRYDLADFVLLKLETFTETSATRARASFLLGVSGLYQADWSAAFSAFARYADSGAAEADVVQAIEALRARKPRFKSASTARMLSTFVPGLGQAYAGHWGTGVNAFVLSAGGALLVVKDVTTGRWFDAAADLLNVFNRFYGGNRRAAAKLANAANARAGSDVVARLYRMLGDK